jgi:hypothetical protein
MRSPLMRAHVLGDSASLDLEKNAWALPPASHLPARYRHAATLTGQGKIICRWLPQRTRIRQLQRRG